MTKSLARRAVGLAALLLVLQVGSAVAAEIKAFMTIGMQSALDDLVPAFEKVSGHKIVPSFATAAVLNKRLQGGEAADLLISVRGGIDNLIKEGKVLVGSDATLARSGVGIAVRKGAVKPDISTPDALKRALLAAKAVSHSDPAVGGASGVHFAKVLERLGIAEEMKVRIKYPPPNGLTARLLVSGDVDMAVQQMPELMSVDGVELVGPLPGDLALTTVFAAGIPASALETDAAKGFIKFLQSPEAKAVMKLKGLEI
jgi:molybdate transport system substrate-binding protein